MTHEQAKTQTSEDSLARTELLNRALISKGSNIIALIELAMYYCSKRAYLSFLVSDHF